MSRWTIYLLLFGIGVAAKGYLIMRSAPAHFDNSNPKFGRLLSAETGSKVWPNYPDPVFVKATTTPGNEDEWPVTVPEVYIGCVREVGPMSTLVVVEGRPYALNGLTKGWTRGGFLLEVDDDQRRVSNEDYPSWWRIGKTTPRVGLYPLFDAARAMGCLDFKKS